MTGINLMILLIRSSNLYVLPDTSSTMADRWWMLLKKTSTLQPGNLHHTMRKTNTVPFIPNQVQDSDGDGCDRVETRLVV